MSNAASTSPRPSSVVPLIRTGYALPLGILPPVTRLGPARRQAGGSGSGPVEVSERSRFTTSSALIRHIGMPIPGTVELPA